MSQSSMRADLVMARRRIDGDIPGDLVRNPDQFFFRVGLGKPRVFAMNKAYTRKRTTPRGQIHKLKISKMRLKLIFRRETGGASPCW